MKWYEVALVVLGTAAAVLWMVLAVGFDGPWANGIRERHEQEQARREAAGYKVNLNGALLWATKTRSRVAIIAAGHAFATLAIADLLARS